jgi:hypothetical protein
VTGNPGGPAGFPYRAGDFESFRRALLLHLPGESALDAWRPTAGADLGLQVVDWAAYVADVLTFYNERIANASYLGTASQDADVRRLVALLGYRPRPGIGATAVLAALASTPGPLVLPAGFAVASKASPQLASQTFETTATATFPQPTSVAGPAPEDLTTPADPAAPPGSVPGAAEPPAHPQLLANGGVLVKGTPSGVKAGDRLLLIRKSWPTANSPAAVVTVTALVTEKDPHGRKNTRVQLSGTATLGSAAASDFRLVRSTRDAHLSSLPAHVTAVTGTTLVLDSTARYLTAGDPLLLELPGAGDGASPGTGFDLVRLKSYAEVVWYADAAAGTPGTPPAGKTGIPLLVASLEVAAHSGANLPATYGGASAATTVRAGWADVGLLLDTPVRTLAGPPSTLTLAQPPAVAAGTPAPAVIEDAHGNGTAVTAVANGNELRVSGGQAGALQPPLRVLWDLVTVSRGATVRDELLGTGDARLPGQDFTLAKSPVTYLADQPGRSGDGYSSTITLSVDGLYWAEVPTLYGRGSAETVFCTWEDADGKTHVRTGDGAAGARLPAGAAVRATYRVGSGAAAPPAGALTQVLSAVPNLRAVRNPVPASGGGDPDGPDRLRALAPRSVLTFSRAVSGDDYAVVAAATPGVTRAATSWEFDPVEQRPTVRVYVGDGPGAVAAATAALRAQADPARPLLVVPAVECPAALSVSAGVDPRYVAAAVLAAVREALLGLFAPGVLGLGEVLYRSRVESVALAVPGVLALHHLEFAWLRGGARSARHRFDPGPGGYFALAPGFPWLRQEGGDDE